MFKTVVYIFLFLAALSVYSMQQLHLPLPAVVNNYANDLLYLPLVLGAIEFLIRNLKKDTYFKLPLRFIIFLACSYSFYFEYYLPKVNTRYTADWIDVTLYFLSGLAYFFVGKRKKQKL